MFVCMTYDKGIVKVRCKHTGIVDDVRDLASDLSKPDSFLVDVVDETFYSEGSGSDGSKVLTVEVHEYAGELPLFTAKVSEVITGAEVLTVDVESGGSEIAD